MVTSLVLHDLINWSKNNFGHLPWRIDRSLYKTLVSEIMLQQTTVSTVLPIFPRFLKKFPSMKALAKASEEEVLQSWVGLGYYRRARTLHHVCKQLVDLELLNDKSLPQTKEEWMQLKGIGAYTSSSLVSIGLNKADLAIDSNLERVLARIFAINGVKGPKFQQKIYSLYQNKKFSSIGLEQVLESDPRGLNEALMDLGRMVCTARKAHCLQCPLKTICQVAQQKLSPLDYPQKEARPQASIESGEKLNKVKKTIKKEILLIRFIVGEKKHFSIVKKLNHEWLSGQYEVPTFTLTIDQDNKTDILNIVKNDQLFKNILGQEELIGFQQYMNGNKIFEELTRSPKSLKFLGHFNSTITHHLFRNIVFQVDPIIFEKALKKKKIVLDCVSYTVNSKDKNHSQMVLSSPCLKALKLQDL